MSGTTSRSALSAFAAIGLLVAAPLAADAGDDHRGHRAYKSRDHHGGGHHQDRRHYTGRRHGGHDKSHAAHAYNYGYGYGGYGRPLVYAPRYRQPVVVHSPFYCAPCGHGFSSRRDFHSHLTGHHGIAAHALSSAIVHTLSGFFFYGY